jgi:putative toxin-antitoxin system antitoxin component (TIGR02293 family)
LSIIQGTWHDIMRRKRIQGSGFAEGPTPFNIEDNRVGTDTLAALSRHGYSEGEIFALVVPKRTLARRKAANEPLTVEETDKALRLDRIAEQAERVFGEPEKAQRWLRKPKRELKGETPLAYLASEAGARVVEEMLFRIEHGMFA